MQASCISQTVRGMKESFHAPAQNFKHALNRSCQKPAYTRCKQHRASAEARDRRHTSVVHAVRQPSLQGAPGCRPAARRASWQTGSCAAAAAAAPSRACRPARPHAPQLFRTQPRPQRLLRSGPLPQALGARPAQGALEQGLAQVSAPRPPHPAAPPGHPSRRGCAVLSGCCRAQRRLPALCLRARARRLAWALACGPCCSRHSMSPQPCPKPSADYRISWIITGPFGI